MPANEDINNSKENGTENHDEANSHSPALEIEGIVQGEYLAHFMAKFNSQARFIFQRKVNLTIISFNPVADTLRTNQWKKYIVLTVICSVHLNIHRYVSSSVFRSLAVKLLFLVLSFII